MIVTRDKEEQRQVWLTIQVTPDEIEEGMQDAYRHLVQRVKIPGFRKGKAPRVILERHVGKEGLREDAIEHIVPEVYKKAISEQKLEPIAPPGIEITQQEPLVFKAVVPLAPVVELGDYQGIRLAPEEVKIGDDEVTQVIEQLRHQKANWQPVERAVKAGDLLVIDLESKLADNPLLNRKAMQYHASEESQFPAPGFAHEVIGMTVGQEKEFNITYPEGDSRSKLAGKEACFKVRVNEVKEEVLPELNDDFAREVDKEVTGLDALREKIRTQLIGRAEQKAKEEFETKVCDEVVARSKVEFPPVMVASETDRIIEDELRRWQQELDVYLKMINKTEEALRQELKPVAERTIARSLVLAEVAKKEAVTPGEEEINAEIENLTKGAGESEDKLKELFTQPENRRQVASALVTRKTLARLSGIAKGEAAGAEQGEVNTESQSDKEASK
jgi:trigger factor